MRSRSLWGTSKREQLEASLTAPDFAEQYELALPTASTYFRLRPLTIAAEYEEWPSVVDLADGHFNGPIERRGNSLIAVESATVAYRLQSYFDPQVKNEDIAAIHPSLMMTGNRIVGPEARATILEKFQFDSDRIVPYSFKPFDLRYCYLENLRPLFSEPSPELIRTSLLEGNSYFITRDAASKTPEGAMMLYSSVICDYDCISGHARHFPIFVPKEKIVSENGEDKHGNPAIVQRKVTETVANLSLTARKYLAELGFGNPDEDAEVARLIWYHALAIGYAPQYRDDHSDGIEGDWPCVPLPVSATALNESAALGARVAALLDVARPVPGISIYPVDENYQPFGALMRADGKQIQVSEGDLKVSEDWGYIDKAAKTQAGNCKPRWRAPSSAELLALSNLGLPSDEEVGDVYLNANVFWSGVPQAVWETVIGGHLVMKKWLSYRDIRVLKRDLTLDETSEVQAMTRRLLALKALEISLNENYVACSKQTWEWIE